MTTQQLEQRTATGRSRSRQRSGTLTTVVGLLFSSLFLIGGMLLIGFATAVVGHEFWMFLAGILAACFAFFIPLSIVRRVDGA